MQTGFGAAPTAAPQQNTGDPLLQGTGIFHISNKEGQNRRTIFLLDDDPVWGYRHLIKRPYNPGQQSGNDWRERDIRMTCAVSQDPQDHPKECLLCEAAMRNGETIKRKFTANLSLIDEGEHKTKKGAVYYDLKKLLELDWTYYNAFAEQKKAIGSIANMRFSVLRPTGDAKQSKTFGNVWTPLGQQDPVRHFWNSPAVRNIAEMASKRGERIDQQGAVQRLIAKVDYAKELSNYSPQLAERFLARALAKNWAASQDQSPGANGGGFYQPGAGNPIGGGAPTMPAYSVPQYAPAGAPTQPQPGYQPQPALMGPPMGAPVGYDPNNPFAQPGASQGQPMQPQPVPQGFQQGFPAGPAPVGNPPQATMPQPMMPAPQAQAQAPAWPQPQPMPQGQPQPMPQPQFPQPQPMGQPQSQPAQNYGFEQAPGWSPQFPGAQGVPQSAPAGPPNGFAPMQPAPQMQPQPMPQGFPPQGQPQPMPTGQRIPPPPAGPRPF